MKQQQDYIRDITEIRSMMERSTKFLSLSGWAGIMAGIYALAGVWIAWKVMGFKPAAIIDDAYSFGSKELYNILLLGSAILLLAICTAFYLSGRKAMERNEKLWNSASRRLLINMLLPLLTGGLLILILLSKGFIGLALPLTLIFYGLSLIIASKFTFDDIKILGLVNIVLGLTGTCFINYALLLWALGFGAGHIIYGIYLHIKYEK